VHLTDWPTVNSKLKTQNSKLIEQMKLAREVVEYGLAWRKNHEIKVKTPVGEIPISSPGNYTTIHDEILDIVLAELNAKNIRISGKKVYPTKPVTFTEESLKAEGEAREIVRMIQEERKKIGTELDEKVNVLLESWPEEFENYIKKKTLVNSISKGDFEVRRI